MKYPVYNYSKQKGPIAIKSSQFIDATGDADVVYSAGVPYVQGAWMEDVSRVL